MEDSIGTIDQRAPCQLEPLSSQREQNLIFATWEQRDPTITTMEPGETVTLGKFTKAIFSRSNSSTAEC